MSQCCEVMRRVSRQSLNFVANVPKFGGAGVPGQRNKLCFEPPDADCGNHVSDTLLSSETSIAGACHGLCAVVDTELAENK
jgi:hypothetical protein